MSSDPPPKRQATIVITYDGARISLNADVSPPETIALLDMAKHVVLQQNMGRPGVPVSGPAEVHAGSKVRGRRIDDV